MENLVHDVYVKIFILLPNLRYLDIDLNDMYPFTRSLLNDLALPMHYSSNIVHIRIKMHDLDDCLSVVSRFSQLHTFIVTLDYIEDTSTNINNPLKKYTVREVFSYMNPTLNN